MIIYTMTQETKTALVAALRAHGTDPLATCGLGRIRRDDDALATEGIVAAWPADADGMYRIALDDKSGLLAWRCYMLAEIAAGRGRLADRDDYESALGISTVPAFEYVCAAAKGRGVRPCRDADHDFWSSGTSWVVNPDRAREPKGRFSGSAWRGRADTHRALAGAGLALPGRNVWSPVATALFVQPRPAPAPVAMAAEDDAAICDLVA
ncbi:hypothetical protein HNR60_001604 [Rhodopseudomonas rhenobacensis]|uniref:Uncharacterized protein n=1 Tax=Rhodopseudomonas rhenobacensis TaxID=87461 RepID=A0A7W7Z2J4_9BRAD|nr:hypothetical protein [Rhodopseudomonas rhenobacensis]MBB5046855.1 hypothetical protein [Rhodopseudomonas rhenobacensis]